MTPEFLTFYGRPSDLGYMKTERRDLSSKVRSE